MTPTREFAGGVPLDVRRALVAAHRPVTLNGGRAVLGGALLPFARVTAIPGGNAVEFAWPTVVRIMAAGGEFWS